MSHAFSCRCRTHRRVFYQFGGRIPAECRDCKSPIVLDDVVNPVAARDGSTVEDITVTPELAQDLLITAVSVEGPNKPHVVKAYTHLMRIGQWVDMTLERGGDKCPIVIDENGHIRYGLQRLEACVASGATIRAVLVTWPQLAAV